MEQHKKALRAAPKMAEVTTEGPEQDSQRTADQNGAGETGETGKEEQALPDPKQEPGDNESGAGMDVNGGHGAVTTGEEEEEEDNSSPVPNTGKETVSPTENRLDGEGETGGKLSEAGKSPVRGSLASSTEGVPEGSRVLKQEQREEESVSSPPTDHTKTAEKGEHGTKRRASVEMSSSDGEPLSRVDSEDRSVQAESNQKPYFTVISFRATQHVVLGTKRGGIQHFFLNI